MSAPRLGLRRKRRWPGTKRNRARDGAEAHRRLARLVAVGSAIELGLADESCDVVVCLEVLEHLPAEMEMRALPEFHRALRPGRMLFMSTRYASLRSRALYPADLELLLRRAGEVLVM